MSIPFEQPFVRDPYGLIPDVLASCCQMCLWPTLNSCNEHLLPEIIVMAGREAGCLKDDRDRVEQVAGHGLVFDGTITRHLHHEGVRDILTLPRLDSWDIVQSILGWIESVHHGWLGD